MARLKEKDKRPAHQFKPGDIVRVVPGKVVAPLDEGIVLEVESYPNKPGVQVCHVFFAARRIDVWIMAKHFAKQQVMPSHLWRKGIQINNTDLRYLYSKPDWLKPPSKSELRRMRYMGVLDDISGS